jgi:hypothetical protein
MVEKHFARFFEKLVGGATAVEIHQDNLVAFGRRWKHIQSKSTCFCCLRQRPRPQPPCGLPCGHCFCDSCVAMFGDGHGGNPYVFGLQRCLLCRQEGASDVASRPVVVVRERIQPRTGLPTPLQGFAKVALGVGIGGFFAENKKQTHTDDVKGAVVAVGRCINSSRPLGESIEKIPELMARRMPLNLALVSRACQLAITHGTAGFRLAGSMESVLHEILGADKRILARSSTIQTNEDSAHADSAALWYVSPFRLLLCSVDWPRSSSNSSLFPKSLEATEATHPEPGPGSCKLSADGRRSVYGMIGRTVGLLPEKPTQKPQELQEKPVERICKTAILTGKLLHRYHPALTQRMDTAVRHLLASLFYLELDPLPQHEAGKYVLTGRLLCPPCDGDPAFLALLQKVRSSCSRFLVNGCPLAGEGNTVPCLGEQGRFCLQVRTRSEDKLTISLEFDGTGRPLSVQGAADAQGLDATPGRSNRKRKRPPEQATSPQKRRKGSRA